MSSAAIAELAKMLQLYGGWGMTAVLIWALLWFYKHTSKLLDERNDRFIELLRECSVALTSTEKAIDQIRVEVKSEVKEYGQKIGKLEERLETYSSELKLLIEVNKVIMRKLESKL